MSVPSAHHIQACRFCGGALSIPFCDLGKTPLANSFVPVEEAELPDRVYPLNAKVCERCFLVQLDHIVDAEQIFSDYAYFSSYSSTWLEHAAEFVRKVRARLNLDGRSFVVEVASNDGYLLRNFVSAAVPCLGIEPARNIADVAIANGVPTMVRFFGREAAEDIVSSRGHADLVIANNVIAHVPDLNDFAAGLALLAGPAGVVSIEVPHLLALIDGVQFDTIYHEHYSYWSLHAMEGVLAAHGLGVFDVELLPTHGTSLRIFATRDRDRRQVSPGLERVRGAEARANICAPELYLGFEARVGTVIDAFRRFLAKAKSTGRSVYAYGAAAKGNTFLNACGATAQDLHAVADLSPEKQGRLLPGSRIPIITPEELISREPDDVIILPWNLAGEIAPLLRPITARGGRLFVAIPKIEAVGPPR